MANANIQITLSDGEPMGALLRYEPGSALRGTVQLTTDGAINYRAAYIRLQWRTEGRGDRDQEKCGERLLAEGALVPNANLSKDFNFTLPREPWSFAGHYINLVWEIAVVVDLPLARDIVQAEQFILAPRR